MDLAVSLIFFIVSIIFVIVMNFPLSLAMFAGFFGFLFTAVHRGFTLKNLIIMSLNGIKNSLIVVRVLLTIGILTGLWRSAGTFAVLTYWGLRLITPSLFIFEAFIMSCILSYSLGTSFGTVGTLGIALMTLARSGGVDLTITAGAILSGIYFGDRGSPASSCAHLVASLTHTDIYLNVKNMMKSALIPLILSSLFYLFISIKNPLNNFDSDTLNNLSTEFNVNPLTIFPAVFMIILPLMKINIFIAFLVSIIAAFFVSIFIQGYNVIETLRFSVFGMNYESGMKALFNGGGFISMIQTCLIIMISGTYSGIFEGTRMLDGLQDKISGLIKKFGASQVILLIGTMNNAVFCNQTIGVIMTSQLMSRPYRENNISDSEFALDMSNSVVMTAALVPWCIACSVPLGILGASFSALEYACYIYLIPFCWLITRNFVNK